MIKTGTRLQSQVCDTQVIVVKAADSLDDLRCGGHPMAPLGAERLTPPIPPAFATAVPWASAMSMRVAPRYWSPRLVRARCPSGRRRCTVKEAKKPLPASD